MSNVETETELNPIERHASEITESVMGCILATCDVLIPDALRTQIFEHVSDGLYIAHDQGFSDALADMEKDNESKE